VVTPPPVLAVPRLWPGGTIACLGGGPSLTQDDVDHVRGRADGVIAINDTFRLAPWADVLYACDAKWWYWHWKKGAGQFAGLKFALAPQPEVRGVKTRFNEAFRPYRGVTVLRNTGDSGLELDPTALRAGRNSGYQAINLAVHLGAKRVILLGYDMRGGHWHQGHPDGSRPPFNICLRRFETLVEPLRKIGVEVLNCTPRSALTAFPCAAVREVLP
jgi:hypothetical protein